GGVGHQVVNYLWNFGDGQLGDTGNSRYADHTFASTGVYTVQLTVTDETGLIGSTSQAVTVTAGNPVADFTSSVTNAGTHAMSFDGRLSAASGTATISTYSWNFGDGGSGTGPTPAHTYASTNTYTVTLTITDSTGKTGVVSKNVSVP
ncbi:MAG: PKD domain-containing protein, partial [Vicinamibacterales bacterium]